MEQKDLKRTVCEIWSRISGYLRPTSGWNDSKQEEFKNRVTFSKHE